MELKFNISGCDGTEYVLFPACAYRGNQFDVLKKTYPPVFSADEARVDMLVTISDVPRLNKDGSGCIQVTTGDVSVPCAGIYSAKEKKATLVFTVQQINGKNLGLAYEKGCISITYPAKREYVYRMAIMLKNEEPYHDVEGVDIPCKLIEAPCEDLAAFYRLFFENRKCMGLDDRLPHVLPAQQQFEIQRKKFNEDNYSDFRGYHLGRGIGWCGNGMVTYALMKLGGQLEWDRGVKSLNFIFDMQRESGFFEGVIYNDGRLVGDGWDVEGTREWHLIRRSADVLCFLFKHFDLFRERKREIPQRWIDGTKKLADAFVKLWNEYGQLGQFVNVRTGKIIVGGSTSGGIAPAGLAKAYRFFNEPVYLKTAGEIAEHYYSRDLCSGYTTGGPSEMLQCPDSESAFGLLESFVELYDATRKSKWLSYAEFMAHLCASWVVPYNYKFPVDSEFGRLDMKTVGSVFANAQNKHSAPGICTLSGDSLLRLYRFTGDDRYLTLIREIGCTISQYMSTNERPIYDWDAPKDAALSDRQGKDMRKHRLREGRMHERVNMSDWETKKKVGGTANDSCWSECSNLLTLAEILLEPKWQNEINIKEQE